MNKKTLFYFFPALAAGLVFYFVLTNGIFRPQQPIVNEKETVSNKITPMQITSPAFAPGGGIPQKYTCEGEGINPPLVFQDIPREAKALALVVDDPDAQGRTWVHWLVWNVNAATKGIAENSVPPEATEGVTDFGQKQYGAPCPPGGSHRYFFKLYALDLKLNISSFSDKAALEKAMEGHILARAELVGFYQKKSAP